MRLIQVTDFPELLIDALLIYQLAVKCNKTIGIPIPMYPNQSIDVFKK